MWVNLDHPQNHPIENFRQKALFCAQVACVGGLADPVAPGGVGNRKVA